MKVAHIITTLDPGGTETFLTRLIPKLAERGVESEVLSLKDIGPLGMTLREQGVRVTALNLNREKLKALPAMARWLRQSNFDVIQTWLYHADLVGGLMGKLVTRAPIIWGLRHADLSPDANKKSTLKVAKLCAYASNWTPRFIVSNSEVAIETHTAIGYSRQRMRWIPNGFEPNEFHADQNARNFVRRNLELPNDAFVFGHFARLHPQKDHKNLLTAAAQHFLTENKTYFILAGKGVSLENPEWRKLLETTPGLKNYLHRFRFLDHQSNLRPLTAAIDAGLSSSLGEGFPNFIAEIMLHGKPCVVTDAGDSATIVDKTGIIVPKRNPSALAAALSTLATESPTKLHQRSQNARNRITTNYSLNQIATAYANLYQTALQN